MTILPNSPLVFKYLDLPVGARGGVTRFFLLSQNIPFEEQLIPMGGGGDAWSTEKKRLIETGENPSGSLPILYSGQQAHPQHIASIRYLARVHQLTSGDDYKDYVQDLVADEYQGFRDQWVKVTFTGSDDDKAEYKKGSLVDQLIKFNALYENFQTDKTFLSVSAKTGQPLWGDAAMYGLVRDHILTGYISLEDLAEYPRLLTMYQAYESIPAVKEWLEGLFNKQTDEKKTAD
jgi:hypothetical protein